ncbi:MAG: hypothetical protein JW702_08465 [Clostridiales bacterium]|nr:hypothetical protein [Clostridiales bacterium]
MNQQTKKKLVQPLKNILSNLPIMLSIILILGLVKNFISFDNIAKLFSGNPIYDTFLGSILGSIMAGNSINSYIIGTEMLHSNISIYAIIAFLASWVTVGFIQIPAEISYFGKKFTFIRNVLSVFLSMLTGIIVGSLLGVL